MIKNCLKRSKLPSGLDFNEEMSSKLISALGPKGYGPTLGIQSFENKRALDVGTRDGRYIGVLRELGATEVYGIDPDTTEIARAITGGILDEQHAIPKVLADLPEELEGTFDIATVFNFNIPFNERYWFIEDLYHCLKSEGQAILTFAENEVLDATYPTLMEFFAVKNMKLMKVDNHFPNNYLVVASKVWGIYHPKRQ